MLLPLPLRAQLSCSALCFQPDGNFPPPQTVGLRFSRSHRKRFLTHTSKRERTGGVANMLSVLRIVCEGFPWGGATISLKRRRQDAILRLRGPIVLGAVGALPARLSTVGRPCPRPLWLQYCFLLETHPVPGLDSFIEGGILT